MISTFLLIWPHQLRTLFLLTLIPGLLVVGLLVRGLQEQKRETLAEPSESLRAPWSLRPLHAPFRLYLISLIIFTLGNSSDAFLLVRASELGVPTAWLPLLWTAFHLVKSGGNLLAGRAADAFGTRPLIIGGWLIYAAIYLLFALITSAWQVWVTFLLYGIFYAMTEPAEKKLVTQLVPADQKGLAFGWYHLSMGIAALPASVIFGWLYQNGGPLAAFGTGAVLATVAALLVVLVKFEPEDRLVNS